MNSLRVIFAIASLALALGCGPKAPDRALILWEQADPRTPAIMHALEKRMVAVAFTGTSMEPFLTAGDWLVADTKFPWDNIQPGDLLIYKANWLAAEAPMVCHMAAAKAGDGWVMNGIANPRYENGAKTLMRDGYRGKVIQVYTKRKPG